MHEAWKLIYQTTKGYDPNPKYTHHCIPIIAHAHSQHSQTWKPNHATDIATLYDSPCLLNSLALGTPGKLNTMVFHLHNVHSHEKKTNNLDDAPTCNHASHLLKCIHLEHVIHLRQVSPSTILFPIRGF